MSNWVALDERQFVFPRPGFFEDPHFDWVSFGETRRVPDSSEAMSGSIALSDGIIDRGLSLQFKDLAETDPATWAARRAEQRWLAAQRIEYLREAMGLRAIGALRATHGMNLMEITPDNIRSLRPSRGSARPEADAAVTHEAGFGMVINPADCAVASLVHAPNSLDRRAVAQIHAGLKGLAGNIVGTSMTTLKEKHGFDPAQTYAYIQPHATAGFTVHGKALDNIRASYEDTFLSDTDDPNDKEIHMTKFIMAQLEEAGINPDHVTINSENSLTSPTLYSHRAAKTKGFAGRNALAIGMRVNLD